MLDEYKQLYEECANRIENWKNMSKSELANKYIEHENEEIANSYLSALLCKYWNLIGSYFFRQGIRLADETDCYDWVIDGILRTLEKRVWLNPDNVLYNDPKGPEKAITICIHSTRLTYYQSIKHDKRSLNYNKLSLEQLEENSSDGYYLQMLDNNKIILNDYIINKFKEFLDKKDYFMCFLLDALINSNIIVENKQDKSYNVSMSKFTKYILEMEDSYLHVISNNYKIPYEDIKESFFYLKIMPSYRIQNNLSRALNLLSRDTDFKFLLCSE